MDTRPLLLFVVSEPSIVLSFAVITSAIDAAFSDGSEDPPRISWFLRLSVIALFIGGWTALLFLMSARGADT